MTKENTEKIDEIKQRILYFIESQKIGKYNFYNKIGLSSSNFAGKTLYCALSSTKISEFLIMFPQISPDWLLLGKGEMLRSEQQQQTPQKENNLPDDYIPQLIASQHKYIHALEAENKQLKEQIAQLKK
jgi:hypothetical protein